MIKVSIIVPVWNAETTLARCIDSLLAQTLDDIEIIAINDGSEDASRQILERYEKEHNPKFRCYSQLDLGQANAVNRGVRLAEGEYIAECDSDDYVHPSMYEVLYTKAKQHDADVVKCNYKAFNGCLKQDVNVWSSRYDSDKVLNINELDYRKKNLLFGHAPTLFCGIYLRSFIQDNALFYREGTIFEDTALMFKIATSADRFVYIMDHLYFYNTGNPNSGTATIKNNIAIIEQFEEIKRFNQSADLHLDSWITVYAWYSFMWAYDRIQFVSDQRKFLFTARDFLRTLPYDPELFNTKEDAFKCWMVRSFEDGA